MESSVLYGQPIEPESLDTRDLAELIQVMHGIGYLDYPMNTIRISNRFIQKGKENSLAAITEYLEVTPESETPLRQLVVLIPILFPMEKQVVYPPSIFVNRADLKWRGPFGVCHVIGDIPFDFRGTYAGGAPENVNIKDLMIWAKKHGVFRSDELEPVADPAQLIGDIEQSGVFLKACEMRASKKGRNLVRKLIRWQIYSLISEPYNDVESPVHLKGSPWTQAYDADFLLEDEVWNEFERLSRQKKWNGLIESYGANRGHPRS